MRHRDGEPTPEALAESDLRANREEYVFPLPRKFISPLLQDDRDLPAAYLIANISLIAVPAAVWLHVNCHSHWVGALYLIANYALFLQRYMLTLHFTEHRRLFKSEYSFLNHLAPTILSSLYGVPPGLYRPHHIVMHHVEDNRQGRDLSSTEPFQRDNFLQLLRYWVRFFVGTWLELPWYTASKGRYSLSGSTLTAEGVYWVFGIMLWYRNPVATLWSLVLPFFLSSFLLSFGNWSQHIFVDPASPGSPYRSTYNCLYCPDNRRTYNDGYHIIHHLNSRMHWSELPIQFLKTLEEHDREDALCFHSIGFFDVGLFVFTGQLRKLARFIVPCGPRQACRTEDDWVELLRSRLRPVRSS